MTGCPSNIGPKVGTISVEFMRCAISKGLSCLAEETRPKNEVVKTPSQLDCLPLGHFRSKKPRPIRPSCCGSWVEPIVYPLWLSIHHPPGCVMSPPENHHGSRKIMVSPCPLAYRRIPSIHRESSMSICYMTGLQLCDVPRILPVSSVKSPSDCISQHLWRNRALDNDPINQYQWVFFPWGAGMSEFSKPRLLEALLFPFLNQKMGVWWGWFKKGILNPLFSHARSTHGIPRTLARYSSHGDRHAPALGALWNIISFWWLPTTMTISHNTYPLVMTNIAMV